MTALRRRVVLFLSFAVTVDLIRWYGAVGRPAGFVGDDRDPILTTIHSTSTIVPSYLPSGPEKKMEDAVNACYEFTVGDPEKQTFTSPGYPDEYPGNIECFRVLEAPYGQVIHLHFKKHFSVEGDQCKTHFLEVRDGAHDFNRPIGGPYCGKLFPPVIVSTDRHLWLRFKSDYTVEKASFEAFYEFVKRSDDVTVTVDLIWWYGVVGQSGIKGDKGDRIAATESTDETTEVTAMVPMASFLLDEPQRDMEDTEDPCYEFTVGDLEKQTFTSPQYPNKYPNNIECFRVLEAPPGQVIHLDFREQFILEGDQCKNDFLEIHDGAHGFNKPTGGPYCGTQFPPMTISSDRHLWLHFKSDDTVEHEGFKAVYEFVNRSDDVKTPEIRPCNISISGEHQGRLNKSNIENETLRFNKINKMPIDCIWEITVQEGWKVQLSFKKFKLDRPNDCEANFVDVFSTSTDIPSREKNFCGSIADTVNSKGNVMYIRFFARPEASDGSNFEALFTAFRENEKNADCLPDEFNCDDATCISATLKCNGEFNCRFRWDEDECNKGDNFPVGENHIIIIMVIFSLILSGMCFTFLFNCVKKLIRDHRTIQEYMRQSREQQLNDLGKQEQFEKKVAKLDRSRSNSTQSSDSQRYPAANAIVNTPCYVPGELLPIIIRNSGGGGGGGAANGDAYQTTTTTTATSAPFDDDDAADADDRHRHHHHHHHHHHQQQQQQQPEMCDSACQTRESLFRPYGSEQSTPIHGVATPNSKPSPPAPFSTFGYKKEGKYRAEAKIEIEKGRSEERRRPYSVQTTKSAPDVIVTH